MRIFAAMRQTAPKLAINKLTIKMMVITALFAIASPRAYAQAVSGNIGAQSIEIDANANLHPATTPNFTNGPVLNSGATIDWVKDLTTNTDTSGLTNSIATGIIPGQTGAVSGRGHWYGVRIVDSIANNDQDIFLTGGKENDLSTWNIGPGSVGSSKYDITQAYLANNQNSLFFGMERRGNNGTTAFDFEFNQKAPSASKPLVPTRTVGDVLFTFEMSGSGSSGSAVPYYYVWNGSSYVQKSPAPASLISSINNDAVPAAPWGYVDSQGNWTLGTLPRFEFAEAAVNLADAFPNFVVCNNHAFVQVRTRSSSTATSDLKDTTRIFEYSFGGPKAVAALSPNCDQSFDYDATGSQDTMGGTSLTYRWDFKPATGVTLSGSGITGPDSAGLYHSISKLGTVNVTLPSGVNSTTVTAKVTVIEGTSCTATSASVSVVVLRTLTATITQKLAYGSTLSVTLSGSAPGATSLQWQVYKSGAWVNVSGATTSSFSYSTFEADSSPTVKSFTIDGTTYQGKLYQVQVRLRAVRVANGLTCEAYSTPAVLKKVIAVDP